ncbi:DUF4345 domain-containing protein [Nocardioides marmoriginsengisoli]|uniref:DUF4345 domain-containing protein n=1 Tax=Nocardioides marmoriginsengisoli TaxID=661483 RepID=A0A3N0CB63_9ACTN|nr:DUF4345 family protein [Nocardioides marmoriginsengisoli]RNL60684.1 DUF4345 domain-containing protein [Nocardioides marmoriginsengisoli]
MDTTVIVVAAVFFLGMGLYALAAPAALAAPFHLSVQTPESRSEVRAVYGGFGVAISAVLGAAALDLGDDLRAGIVTTVGVALLGMAAGRLVSRLVDTSVRFYPIWFYFGVEAIAGGVLLLVA